MIIRHTHSIHDVGNPASHQCLHFGKTISYYPLIHFLKITVQNSGLHYDTFIQVYYYTWLLFISPSPSLFHLHPFPGPFPHSKKYMYKHVLVYSLDIAYDRECVYLLVWLIFLHFPGNSKLFLFFSMGEWSRTGYILHIFFIHLFVDGYLGWLHTLVCEGCSINTHVQVSLWYADFAAFGSMPRSGTERSYGRSIFRFLFFFLRHVFTDFRRDWNACSHQQCINSSFHLHLRQHLWNHGLPILGPLKPSRTSDKCIHIPVLTRKNVLWNLNSPSIIWRQLRMKRA